MPLRLKGRVPEPGQLDRRYYMIDLQEGNRRVRLSTGVGDRLHARAKEQLVLDAMRADRDIAQADLVEIVRGTRQLPQSDTSARTPFPSVATAPMTLKQACDQALRDHLPWGRSRRGWADSPSNATYAGQLKDTQRILGPSLPVTQISQSSVEKIITDLLGRGAGHRAPRNTGATINRKMFALFSVLRRLHERGLPSPPIPKYVSFDESDNARQFVFTAEQELELFEQVLLLDTRLESDDGGHPYRKDAHVYYDLFVFLADVGCRLTAGLSVRWGDVFEDKEAVYVRFFRKKHLKGGRPRTTPLTSRVTDVIRRRRTLGGVGPFMDLNKRRAQHLWSAAKARTSLAGERGAVIHALRHTCATRMLQATGDIKLVQDWLGHSAIQTTADIYAKVLVRHKTEAMHAFEAGWNK
jgi:integrase